LRRRFHRLSYRLGGVRNPGKYYRVFQFVHRLHRNGAQHLLGVQHGWDHHDVGRSLEGWIADRGGTGARRCGDIGFDEMEVFGNRQRLNANEFDDNKHYGTRKGQQREFPRVCRAVLDNDYVQRESD
jgi:hypothetical protein